LRGRIIGGRGAVIYQAIFRLISANKLLQGEFQNLAHVASEILRTYGINPKALVKDKRGLAGFFNYFANFL